MTPDSAPARRCRSSHSGSGCPRVLVSGPSTERHLGDRAAREELSLVRAHLAGLEPLFRKVEVPGAARKTDSPAAPLRNVSTTLIHPGSAFRSVSSALMLVD